MKKAFLLFGLSFCVAAHSAHSQAAWQSNTTSGLGNLLTNSNTNNVGINEGSPIDKLTVNGNIGLSSYAGTRFFFGRSGDALVITAGGSQTDGGRIALFSNTHSTNQAGAISFQASGNVSAGGSAFEFTQFDGTSSTYKNYMRIYKDGAVAIGEHITGAGSQTTNFKLIVEKGILTERVKVAMRNDPSNWSDFVFDSKYKLMPLADVESYIAKHKHLPEIPSTEEVHKDGLDLAQMDAKLLQKIEELTLYTIQLQKEVEVLKKKVR